MDDYTKATARWLNGRYRECDGQGVFVAHQPIYGFERGPCDGGGPYRYTTTFQMLRALAHIDGETLLDVGGAEGYKAALAREMLGMDVVCADLAVEACRRATEIYGVRAVPADVHDLPFGPRSFDIVLCSETIEHVTEPDRAIDELLRVASKAVVITLPHEVISKAGRDGSQFLPHAHLHGFELSSLDHLVGRGLTIRKKRLQSRYSHDPISLLRHHEVDTVRLGGARRGVTAVRAFVYRLLSLLVGRRGLMAMVLHVDEAASLLAPSYGGMLFAILRDPRSWRLVSSRHISAHAVIAHSVPHHIPPHYRVDRARVPQCEPDAPVLGPPWRSAPERHHRRAKGVDGGE